MKLFSNKYFSVLLHISKLFSIFATPSTYTGRDTASTKRAGFLCPRLSQYWYSTPSWKLNGSTAPCEWKAEGKAVPLLLSQPQEQIICNAFHRKNLFASEKQYLASNARRSDMHRIHAQPLQQRRSTLRSAIYLTRGHCLPWSYKNPFQEDRKDLCCAGEKKSTNLFGQRIYSTERRPQLPFIIQLFVVSDDCVIRSAAVPCAVTKKAVAVLSTATATNSIINF